MATTSRKHADTAHRADTNEGLSNFAVVAGAGAAGMALGIMAMIGRKVAVQAPTYLAGEWDEALAAEHNATLAVFDALEKTGDKDTIKRSMLLANLKHMLSKHALEEENAVYPALRDAGMTAEADQLNSEHGYVKQYLYELTKMPNGSAEFLPTLRKFRGDIEDHMREEENDLFPKLREKLDDARNAALTKAINAEGFKLA